MKTPKIVLLFLILLFTSYTYAETYKLSGIYEITVPNDWLVVPRTDISKLKNDAYDFAKNGKIQLDVELKDISVPLFAYKEKTDGVYSLTVVVGPAELTKQEFGNLTPSEINNISNEVLKRQIEVFKLAKYSVFSSESGIAEFKGTQAIKTEIIYKNSKGFKVSRAQYTIYRGTATLLVSFEHIALTGEPNYRVAEEQISSYKVLAQ